MERIHSIPLLMTALAVGVFLAVPASSARADEWDQLTYFTFSGPVEIPGVALPAGTYMFKLADADGDRNVVQVSSQDGTKVYATFFAIADERLTPTDKPIVTFEETPAGSPEAIKAWFYTGDTIGHEFVYPKDQAEKIAAATHQPVLSTALPSAKATEPQKKAPTMRINGQGEAQAMHSNTAARTAPMKSLQTVTSPVTPVATSGQTAKAPANAAGAKRARKHLPKTASTLPLIGWLAATSLALGTCTRIMRRRLS